MIGEPKANGTLRYSNKERMQFLNFVSYPFKKLSLTLYDADGNEPHEYR